eukprot:Amastigsp_a359363_3.p3 type:complete len:127 gc:universal Amastigsp_a359363_3:491-111(-)
MANSASTRMAKPSEAMSRGRIWKTNNGKKTTRATARAARPPGESWRARERGMNRPTRSKRVNTNTNQMPILTGDVPTPSGHGPEGGHELRAGIVDGMENVSPGKSPSVITKLTATVKISSLHRFVM